MESKYPPRYRRLATPLLPGGSLAHCGGPLVLALVLLELQVFLGDCPAHLIFDLRRHD
jgi:hypothetical protein